VHFEKKGWGVERGASHGDISMGRDWVGGSSHRKYGSDELSASGGDAGGEVFFVASVLDEFRFRALRDARGAEKGVDPK
jgi:hypothetical protein